MSYSHCNLGSTLNTVYPLSMDSFELSSCSHAGSLILKLLLTWLVKPTVTQQQPTETETLHYTLLAGKFVLGFIFVFTGYEH